MSSRASRRSRRTKRFEGDFHTKVERKIYRRKKHQSKKKKKRWHLWFSRIVFFPPFKTHKNWLCSHFFLTPFFSLSSFHSLCFFSLSPKLSPAGESCSKAEWKQSVSECAGQRERRKSCLDPESGWKYLLTHVGNRRILNKVRLTGQRVFYSTCSLFAL